MLKDNITSDEDEEKEEDESVGVSGDAVGGRELHDDDLVYDEEQVEGGECFDDYSDGEGFI